MEPYKLITFVLMKDSDNFFSSYKNQEWAIAQEQIQRAGANEQGEIVKQRYLQAKSAQVPRALVHIHFERENNSYEVMLTEDVINRQDEHRVDNSLNSHMIHKLGCWDIDRTYWNNFHQNKKVVT